MKESERQFILNKNVSGHKRVSLGSHISWMCGCAVVGPVPNRMSATSRPSPSQCPLATSKFKVQPMQRNKAEGSEQKKYNPIFFCYRSNLKLMMYPFRTNHHLDDQFHAVTSLLLFRQVSTSHSPTTSTTAPTWPSTSSTIRTIGSQVSPSTGEL